MSKTTETKETPLMKQYNAIKIQHPSAILLFRVGDFYETFGDDAIKASKILDIVLARRANGVGTFIELAGFPHHALDNYLPKLLRAGERVAICDQLEDPKTAKGIVKRGLTELVTPGVSLNDNVLDTRKNNYLASVHFANEKIGIAFLDISTGEFMTAVGDLTYIEKLLQSFAPSELIFSREFKNQYEKYFSDKFHVFLLESWVYHFDYAYEKLIKHFQTSSLKGFGIENLTEGIIASGAILYYLAHTEHHEIGHITSISRIEEDKYVWLDRFTIRNLELIQAQQEGGVPLSEILDQTITPMGARLMRKWMVMPLKNLTQIQERLDTVDFFVKNEEITEKLMQLLKPIGDLERTVSKIAVGRINPREMGQLKKSLAWLSQSKEVFKNSDYLPLQKLADLLNPCEILQNKIEKELTEHLPILANLGNFVRENVDQELDELRKISQTGKGFLDKIQQQESAKTGIPSLKISFNHVFGYYLEVRNTHKDKVPNTWIRKQTLANAERYITEELKVYEEKILGAEEKILAIEQRIFQELVQIATEYINPIQQNAKIIAKIDALLSFAQIAFKNNYVKPILNESKELDIKNGRHPVIEQQLPLGEKYVPNDIYLDSDSQQILIITGPNMAGKSAILRQTALIVLMAQMGSFVPAQSANLGLIDKVFTRVGASDNLSRGESTFMVEMTETASILNNLSENSLVLMDEIGRGTSTYDGISIAWAIVEYLYKSVHKAKTLFATHYHELNELANDFPRIKNFNVSVKESENKVIFMRKLKEGGSEHSFGIHVAQMAGMPNPIVLRANEIMLHLEKDKIREKNKTKLQTAPKANYQMNVFASIDPNYQKVKEMLNKLDINSTSPVEALLKLHEIQQLVISKLL